MREKNMKDGKNEREEYELMGRMREKNEQDLKNEKES